MNAEGIYKETHVRHLEQLSKLDLPSSTEWQPPVDKGNVLPDVKELVKWVQDNKPAMNAALVSFGKGNSPTTLDLQASLLTLITSSAMYLRDDKKVLEARENYLDYKMSNDEDNDKLHMAIDLLAESIQNIQPVAEALGLKFTAWAELADYTGDGNKRDLTAWTAPYVGAWYSPAASSKASDFVLIAFKGTTPTNVEEILIDLRSIIPVKAEGYLWDTEVASGFYKGLFTNPSENSKIPIVYIQEQCTLLGKQAASPLPLYYLGHSLGAAYATLAFAQTCVDAKPWGNVYLADLCTHGSPRTGVAAPSDGQDKGLIGHIMQFIEGSGGKSHSWRVAYGVGNSEHAAGSKDNWQDCVTLVPPPLSLYKTSFIHVQEGHQIQGEGKVNNILDSEVASEKPLLFVVVPHLLDAGLSHMPSKYYDALTALLYV